MFLTCPACRTRYRVDDALLGGAAGRAVRCANCGHTWHAAPVIVEPMRPTQAAETRREPALVAPSRATPAASTPPLELERRPARAPSRSQTQFPMPPAMAAAGAPLRSDGAPHPPVRLQHSSLALICLALLLLVVAAIAIAVLERPAILAYWPQTARVYALFGLETPAPAQNRQ